jgi:hypothetical protein
VGLAGYVAYKLFGAKAGTVLSGALGGLCPPFWPRPARRRFADRLGLRSVGTLGLLLAARLRGEIPFLRDEIARLRHGGFRAAPALVAAILREAGETEEE